MRLPSTNKYGARKTELDGYTFDSAAEMRRYQELCLLQAAGEIDDLEVHPVYELQPAFQRNGRTERAIRYTADFAYTERGRPVVEDVKGGGRSTQTEAFRIRRRLFLYRYPDIDFRVVEA